MNALQASKYLATESLSLQVESSLLPLAQASCATHTCQQSPPSPRVTMPRVHCPGCQQKQTQAPSGAIDPHARCQPFSFPSNSPHSLHFSFARCVPAVPSVTHHLSADVAQYELMSPSPLSCGSTFIAGGVTGGGGAAAGGGGGMSSTGVGGLAAMSSGSGVNRGGSAVSSTDIGGLAALACGGVGGGSMAGAGGGTIAEAGANASAAGSGQALSADQLGSCNCVTCDR